MRRALILLLVTLAACQDGTDPGPGAVASVEVTPQEAVLVTVGATAQFSARAADDDGDRVEDVTVTWRSSNPAVVRVDDNGLATAVANGTATITAQVETVSGEAGATVCTQPLQVSISAGQLYNAPAGCPLLLPSGVPGDRYRVAIVRLTPGAEATAPTANLVLTPRGIATAPPPAALSVQLEAPEAAAPLAPDQMAILVRAAETARATAAVHARIRESEELMLRRIGPQPLLPFGRSVVSLPDGPAAVSAPKRSFLVRSPSATSCSATPQTATGLLVAENTDIAIYQDSTQAQSLGSRVTQSQARRVLDFYAAHGKPVIQSAFGAPPDRDNNGQVVVLVTPEVGPSGTGGTAAFVWGGDLLLKSVCSASNEMELVYFNEVMFRKMDSGDFQAPETLVHEVKHIVSFFQRLNGNAFGIAPSWAEEGAAEIAGEKASRRAWAATGGPAENAVVTSASFSNNQFTLENYGVLLRLFNSIKYLSTQPNAVVFGPANGAYTVYGSGWHFHRFLGDAYGNAAAAPNADAPFFLQQTSKATPAGLNGLPVLTGGKSFSTLLLEYAGAVMLNGTGAPAPARAFTTYDFPSAATIIRSPFPGAPTGRYPYPVTGTSANPSVPFVTGSWTGPIGNAGLRIHDFTSNGTASAEITVTVEQPARVVVARLR